MSHQHRIVWSEETKDLRAARDWEKEYKILLAACKAFFRTAYVVNSPGFDFYVQTTESDGLEAESSHNAKELYDLVMNAEE